jgi:hypothetical protein
MSQIRGILKTQEKAETVLSEMVVASRLDLRSPEI